MSDLHKKLMRINFKYFSTSLYVITYTLGEKRVKICVELLVLLLFILFKLINNFILINKSATTTWYGCTYSATRNESEEFSRAGWSTTVTWPRRCGFWTTGWRRWRLPCTRSSRCCRSTGFSSRCWEKAPASMNFVRVF